MGFQQPADSVERGARQPTCADVVRCAWRGVGQSELLGTGAGTFNFLPSGLSGYSLNPSVSYSGGFATFQLSNLNQKDFAAAIRAPMDKAIMAHFTVATMIPDSAHVRMK